MIYFFLNIMKNFYFLYWKILLFFRVVIIILDKNGRLNFLKKKCKFIILDIVYIFFLNCF